MKFTKKIITVLSVIFMLSFSVFAAQKQSENVDENQQVESEAADVQADSDTAVDAENTDQAGDQEAEGSDLTAEGETPKADEDKANVEAEAPENILEATAGIAQGAMTETKNMLHLDELKEYLTWGNLAKLITSLIAILIFYIIYRVIRGLVKKNVAKKVQPHTMVLINKMIAYVFYVIMAVYILGLFGIKMSAVWGAAGVAGLAIGFAAQTSVSNLISGLFVLTEKTMKIGDFISVDGVNGTVDSIGLLSVKIHTLDNQMIRIPNSTIINTKLQNFSTYDYRRYVFEVSIDYGSDLDKALEALKKVPAKCPTVINDNPAYAPCAAFTTLGDSAINMNLIVWCKNVDFFATKTDVCMNVVKTFNEEGINIPFNRMDVTLLSEKTIPSPSYKA